MNKIEVRYEVYKMLTGEHRPEGVKAAELVGPDSAEPGAVIEVTTDDPFNILDRNATRRYRVTVEEIPD